MKKVLAVMIGLGLVLGSVSVSFALDSPKTAPKKVKKAKKAKTTPSNTKK